MDEKSDTEKLTGVPETLLVALYLRAVETQRADGIIKDEKAVEMIQSIEYDFIERTITDFSWMEQIKIKENQPVLFIGEGLFMYFEEQEVKNIFSAMADHFPDAELIFEINGPVSVGRSKHHDALSKTDGQAEFKWGPASGAVCETWDGRILFVREWNYLDRHRDRWRFMRLFVYIPPLKRHIMNKIVHLRFRKEG